MFISYLLLQIKANYVQSAERKQSYGASFFFKNFHRFIITSTIYDTVLSIYTISFNIKQILHLANTVYVYLTYHSQNK
jgi:hypothetical protein